MIILLTVCSFLSGALMFSYWLGLAGKKNLKAVGDGNPGALNLWKASGYRLGIAGVLLDFLKGFVPLFLIIESGYGEGYALIPLALAPILGHAFSPFLRGKGGKAIAVTFGVWTALTSFEGALAYAVILALLAAASRLLSRSNTLSSRADGLQVVSGMLLLSVYLVARAFAPAVLWVWFGNFVILLYTHRNELTALLKERQGG
ncbi:glycerol-3-phosphate acyltransferase [Paenibacillus gorillae]|uniref:glycerol-3-phosphate acyltransferase n=1 Tax=Paenibacillus gorillae TaxID=1243662 RepID=UPI0004B2FBF7|nr:glycerol-3-phosphate acyltransferase [Paenibacillus gorillae]